MEVLRTHLAAQLGEGEPRQVGPYRVTGRLGQGGMGTVYLAVGPDGRPVALKRLHPHLAADRAFRARFRREAELARQVDGRFTAAVLDVDLDGDEPWIATEYIAGPSLAEHVRNRGPLPPAALPSFAAAVADALREIHAGGIVHRDLTPRNVLLAADGPRVVDFGIAVGAGVTAITATGQAFGTPGAVAPEVVRGATATPASDIFSWAALVCVAAAGEGPYGTGTPDQLLYRLLHEPPRLPPLGGALGRLLVAALDPEPGRRPDAAAIVAALTGSTVPLPASSEPVTALLRGGWDLEPEVATLSVATPQPPRARRTAALAALALLPALALGAWALQRGTTTPSDTQAVDQAATAEPGTAASDTLPQDATADAHPGTSGIAAEPESSEARVEPVGCRPIDGLREPRGFYYDTARAVELGPGVDYAATLRTTCGSIEIDLDEQGAPNSVASLIGLMNEGYYDGVIFHRVIDGFVIQAGDPAGTGCGQLDCSAAGFDPQAPTYPGFTLPDEPSAADGFATGPNGGVLYPRGTVAMARTTEPNSTGSQFFIVQGDPVELPDASYIVVGEVTTGMNAVEEIASQPVDDADRPTRDIGILSFDAHES